MAKRKVTTIPATINKFTAKPVDSKKKRRVAGYARVSTDHWKTFGDSSAWRGN